jgi:transglutaminase-like putative cysteine protease
LGSIARFAWFLFGSLAVFVPAARADELERAAPAAWVEDLAIPQPLAARLRQAEDGLYYLLLDSQVKAGDGAEVFYTRNAYKVIDRGGLEEAARFEIVYDPSHERVVLHHIRVIRNGVVLDRMGDADIQVMRREKDLDKGIFDGNKTVHVEIKGVEVGDIVDYAYSWQSTSSYWPGQFFAHVTTGWSVPLGLMRYRLIWPADRPPLTVRNRSTTLKPTVTRRGGDAIYEWRTADPEPTHGEDGTPQWYATWGVVSVSSMVTWSEVVNWALPLYSKTDALPSELDARAEAIMKTYPQPEDRITQAMRLVEDEVRYVSLSIGDGSYTPRSPTDVFRSGFGDCKDKSQLLVILLRRMGIEAYVALTDMDKGASLPDVAPAANVFDHAIVQVRFHGRSYWLDPTGSNEGGRFPNLAALNYGWALPIAPGQARLERIARPAAPAQPTYSTVERYELDSGDHPGLTLSVRTQYLDAEADSMRNDIVSNSAAQLESDYLKYYAGMYPGLTRDAPLRIVDDRARNRIVVFERYRLAAADLHRNKLLEKFEIKASSLNAYDKLPVGRRATPYALSWPVSREHSIVLITPGRQPPVPHDAALDNTGFSYRMTVTRADDTLTLDYRLTGNSDVLDAKDVDGAAGDANAVYDDNYWYLDLTATGGGFIGDAYVKDPDWLEAVTDFLALIGMLAIGVALGYVLQRAVRRLRAAWRALPGAR